MLLARRSPYPVALALLLAGAPGCNLVLDIDRLDRGGGGEVEVIADGECRPGKVAVAGGQLYWTITTGSGDESCPTTPRNAIRRLAVGPSGPSGTPADVVTENLDGQYGTGRPWQIAVVGDDLYWVGSAGKVCLAEASGTNQDCDAVPTLPPQCPSLALSRVDHPSGDENEALLYLHAGDCMNGEIHHYDTKAQDFDTTGLSVSGTTVNEIEATSAAPGWVAWVDKPPSGCLEEPDEDARRISLALPDKAGWSSCSLGSEAHRVRDIAIDGDHLYWIEVDSGGSGSLYALPLSTVLAKAPKSALVVSGLTEPNALALDGRHVYITSLDRNGAVLYVPKGIPAKSLTPDDLGVLAEDREVPYDITAEDADWVYWLCSGTRHTVERARKPVE